MVRQQLKLVRVRDHIPLEQGLRLITSETTWKFYIVRDHIPLEQGLRPSGSDPGTGSSEVRDHIPLEQGLRLTDIHDSSCCQLRQRPYSIRTRIKTYSSYHLR